VFITLGVIARRRPGDPVAPAFDLFDSDSQGYSGNAVVFLLTLVSTGSPG
jgi:hypothetical protein